MIRELKTFFARCLILCSRDSASSRWPDMELVQCHFFPNKKGFVIIQNGQGLLRGSWWTLSFHFDGQGKLIDCKFLHNRRGPEDKLYVGYGLEFHAAFNHFFE